MRKPQTFDDRQTPEQRKFAAEHKKRHDDFTRSKNNSLKFWRVCRERPCRRAKSCLGDMHACFTRHWAAMPEEIKVWIRAGITARADGLSVEEAVRAAEAAVARHHELMAKFDRQDAQPAPAAPSAAPPKENSPHEPAARIRQL